MALVRCVFVFCALLFFVINTKKLYYGRYHYYVNKNKEFCILFFLTAIRLALVVLATATGSTGAVSLRFGPTLLEWVWVRQDMHHFVTLVSSFWFRQRPLLLVDRRGPWLGVVLSAVVASAVDFGVGAPAQDQAARTMQAQPDTDAGSAVVVAGSASEDDGGEGVAASLDGKC